jgi:FtsP/CotA-like multicopper oxidase with cupredoxin domain
VIVDFGDFAGIRSGRVALRGVALPAGIVSPARALRTVMEFRVSPPTSKDASSRPAKVAQLTADTWQATLGTPSATRTMILEEVMGPDGPLASIVNYRSFEGRPVPPEVWMDPAHAPRYPFSLTAEPRQLEDTIADGATEEWQFVNATADTHPMHLHLVQFGLVKREAFDAAAYSADLMVLHAAGDDVDAAKASGGLSARAEFDGNRLLPRNYILPGAPTVPIAPEESGWKDTVRANPGEVTTIRARFSLGSLAGDHQDYVTHCHILEHETNSMMRAFRVQRPG